MQFVYFKERINEKIDQSIRKFTMAGWIKSIFDEAVIDTLLRIPL